MAAYIAGVIPLDFLLTSAPNAISFFTVSKSPLAIEVQNGLTETLASTNSKFLIVFSEFVAFKLAVEHPNAIAIMNTDFFMKKSVFIIAIALGCSTANLNATNSEKTIKNLEFVEAKVSVSPFCTSIAKGDLETVKKLIALGADVNKKSNGMTPAMYAAKYNRAEILKLLVSKGADLGKKSENGLTAEKYAKLSNAQEALAVILNSISKKENKI